MNYQALLLLLPPLLLTTYFFSTSAPFPPDSLQIHPSLASLPKDYVTKIYPEDIFENGAYVMLPYGRVRYWIIGPETGQKVVLIHGLSMPSLVFKDIAPMLASRGYRVLIYDLYGRGYSEAPAIHYTSQFFTTQLALLMQHIHWSSAHILGVSMGGGIAAAFVRDFPGLVDEKVVLICPAGLINGSDMSRTTKFLSSSFVQWVTTSYPIRRYLQYLADPSDSSIPTDPITEIVRIQSAHLPGYNPAIASSIRHGPIRGMHSAFSSPHFKTRSVLIIHGTEDRVVPFKYAGRVRDMLPEGTRRRLVVVEGRGHGVMVEEWERVGGEVGGFFEEG